MTEGLFCAACRKNIHEQQPHCDQCGVSICFSCATSYNSVVRAYLFRSKIKTLSEPIISISELKQFYNDISGQEMMDEIIRCQLDSHDFDDPKSHGYHIEFYKNDMKIVKTFLDKMFKKYNMII